MQPFALIWVEFHAAQQSVREIFEPSPLPDEESHLNSWPAVAQPDGEIVGQRGASDFA
jgi:hypothetical protein